MNIRMKRSIRMLWTLMAASLIVSPASAGPLQTARSAAVAVKLADGRVLVVGGIGSSGNVLSSSEIFDPATGNFTTTGSMAVARTSHTATRLTDGRVLVAGGEDAGHRVVASVELYNPATGVFVPAANMVKPRSEHTAVLLGNGKVLASGGDDGASGGQQAAAELYDPVAGVWVSTGGMVKPRSRHAAALLNSGRVVVCGGHAGSGTLDEAKSAEQFDPATGTWTALASMNHARAGHVAVLLLDGKVFIVGSNNGEVFDPAAGTFTLIPGEVPPARTVREEPSAVRLVSGDVLVYGGALFDAGEGFSKTQFRYAVGSNSYVSLQPNVANAGRGGCPAVLLDDGRVLIVGGTNADSPALSSAILYSPSNDTFSIP